jgi:hypothetical protein
MLKLWASPEQHGELAKLMLVRAEDEPELVSCELRVMVNGAPLAAPKSKPARKHVVSSLVTEISRDIVREIGTAQQLALRACSRRFSLDGGQLQRVHRFAGLSQWSRTVARRRDLVRPA